MTKTVLITGANRGIGLEFAQQYADDQWQVIACCRQPENAKALQALAKEKPHVRIVPLDIDHPDQINTLREQLSDTPLDCLINNAGIYAKKGECLKTATTENMLRAFTTNVCGTLAVTQALTSLVANSQEKLIVTISSKMGSIDDNQSGGAYAYRAGKSALNAVMKSLSIDVKDQGIRVLTLHPGWVKTDMGGKNALITTQTSVSGMREVIADHRKLESGGFYNYDGKEIAW